MAAKGLGNEKAGAAVVTLDDIARETGFHRTTVSQVLNGNKRCYASQQTRRVIHEAARRLNFVPNYFARSLQKQRSQTVGVASRLQNISVTAPMLNAIVEGLRAREYMPLLCDSSPANTGGEQAVRELRGRLVDGIILEGPDTENALDLLLPESFPCVAIRSVPSANGRPCVVADRFEAMGAGVRWLAERGHRRIAFVGADNLPAMRSPTNTQRLRIEGYRAAMQNLGLFDEGLILDGGPRPGDVCGFILRRADLFRSITAVLASNDRIAVEVINGLGAIGVRVPEDCSVIGFGDVEFAVACAPRLTTFQPHWSAIGAKAVEMVLDRIEGRPVASATFVPQLVVRESAGPCRRN